MSTMQPVMVETALEPTSVRPTSLTHLVREAQAGSPKAFEQLYLENVDRIFALCLRIAGDSTRAEELTQDVFVRAWQMIRTFRGEAAFSSWLHRLAVNVVLVDFRSRQRREKRVFSAEDIEAYDRADPMPTPGTGIDLESAVASLPPQARTVFVLHDVEGYRHEEIAQLLGLATGTCKAQLHRARKLLKEVLGR